MPVGVEVIPEIMDNREEIARIGDGEGGSITVGSRGEYESKTIDSLFDGSESLGVSQLKHEVDNVRGDWHPSEAGVFEKHDGFSNMNSSNRSFPEQREENRTDDGIDGTEENERGTSLELSKDTSHIEEERNTKTIEPLHNDPEEVHHPGNETGKPLVEKPYPHTSADVNEVEARRITGIPVLEILPGKGIETENVNEGAPVRAVEPSIECETGIREKDEATEAIPLEEPETISYRGRDLVEEGYRRNLQKVGLKTQDVLQMEETLQEGDEVGTFSTNEDAQRPVMEGGDETTDQIEGNAEHRISKASFLADKIDVEVPKKEDSGTDITCSEEVASGITNVKDVSVDDLLSAVVFVPQDEILKTRDDDVDKIAFCDHKQEGVQDGVIGNDSLSKDRELTATETAAEEMGQPALDVASNDDSRSHPEREQQWQSPEASTVKDTARESEADTTALTEEFSDQVAIELDNASMGSIVCRETVDSTPEEDSSLGKLNLIYDSYNTEAGEEVKEAEDKRSGITEEEYNNTREYDSVPKLTQDEFQSDVAGKEAQSSVTASNEFDIVGGEDKSSGLALSEDQTTNEYEEVSSLAVSGEVVQENASEVSTEQADAVPHGDDDSEAYSIKDDDIPTRKDDETLKSTDREVKTEDESDPIEVEVPTVVDSSEDFAQEETQDIHSEQAESLTEISVPTSEQVYLEENIAKEENDNVTENSSPLTIPENPLERLDSEETDVDRRLHTGVSALTDTANELSETQTANVPEALVEEKLDVDQRSDKLDTEIFSVVTIDGSIDDQSASNEASNYMGTSVVEAAVKKNKIQEEVAEGERAQEQDGVPNREEVLGEPKSSASNAPNEKFEQLETEVSSEQPRDMADQGDIMPTEVLREPIEKAAIDTAIPNTEASSAVEAITKSETLEEKILTWSLNGDTEAQIGHNEVPAREENQTVLDVMTGDPLSVGETTIHDDGTGQQIIAYQTDIALTVATTETTEKVAVYNSAIDASIGTAATYERAEELETDQKQDEPLYDDDDESTHQDDAKIDIRRAETSKITLSETTEEAASKIQEDDSFQGANNDIGAGEVSENPTEESAKSPDEAIESVEISDGHQYMEGPVLSQGNTVSSPVDEGGTVGPTELNDTADSVLEMKEDTVQTEDVPNGESGIINELPTRTGIAEGEDLTDVVEKDLVDATETEEKIDAGEVASQTKNINSREVSFEGERATELISSDQTVTADQIEEEITEILDSDDRNDQAIEYPAHGETAQADDRQASINEASIEQTEEGKAALEVDRNTVSGTETGIIDAEPTQISRGVNAETFKEGNSDTENIELKDSTKEVTETEEIVDAKGMSEEAALSRSELVESTVAEEGILSQSLRTEISHEGDSSLLMPEENEVKDQEAISAAVTDSFSIKEGRDIEEREPYAEISRPEKGDFLASEVETTQILSVADDVDITASTITVDSQEPGMLEGDIHEAENQELSTSDLTKDEECIENKVKEDDNFAVANSDLEASAVLESAIKDSAISEEHQYVEDPALSQGDTSSYLMGENTNEDERGTVGSPEFPDATDLVQETKEDSLQTEDDPNSESGIVFEPPLAGTGIAEDKYSTDIVEKDLIDRMGTGKKIDAGEVSLETKNVDLREVEFSETPGSEPSFDEEHSTEVITSDQTVVIDQTEEERNEILNFNDKSGKTEEADDSQSRVKETSVEQTEEKAAVEIDSNTLSGTETCIIDAEPTQISRNIYLESFKEGNSATENTENKVFFDEEGKYNMESKDLAEEDTKSEEIVDAKEMSEEATLSHSQLVESAVSEEGILDQSRGTEISYKQDSSLVPPEENEVEEQEVPSGLVTDSSEKQKQDTEKRNLLASEVETTQKAEAHELSISDMTTDEASVENKVEASENECIHGLPNEDDQQEISLGISAEEVPLEEEITSKGVETDRIVQEDESGHNESENSTEANEDVINKDSKQNDNDDVDMRTSVINEEMVETTALATETAGNSFVKVIEGEQRDPSLSKETVEEADSYAACAETPFSARTLSDGENARELISASLLGEDGARKEEVTDADIEETSEDFNDSKGPDVEATGQRELVADTEVSDEVAPWDVPNEMTTTFQTQPTNDSYEQDTVELMEENKFHAESAAVNGSTIEFNRENEHEVMDKMSDEQTSQVQIDNTIHEADTPMRDIPATAENVGIDRGELDEQETRSSGIGEQEPILSRELSTSDEAFFQTDQVDDSLPPKVEVGGNENNEVLQNETETEISLDGPSNQVSDFSTSVPKDVQEMEICETVASEYDQMSRTIQEVSDCADVDGVAAVDTETGIVKTTEPTQSTSNLENESIGETSTTVAPDENDDSKEEIFISEDQDTYEQILLSTDRQVELNPRGEAVLAETEDVVSASIGERTLDQNPLTQISREESTLFRESEKESEYEVVRSSAMNEVWSDGNKPMLQTDVSQDESDSSMATYADEKRVIQESEKATPLERGDQDFASAVHTKEVLTKEDTSKVKEVLSEDGGESIDDTVGEVIPMTSDTQPRVSSEYLDGGNAGELNTATVSVENGVGKEEGTDAGIEETSKDLIDSKVDEVEATGQRDLINTVEVSDEDALSDVPNEMVAAIQTVPTNYSYKRDSVKLTMERKVHEERAMADDSSIWLYEENEKQAPETMPNEQASQLEIDNPDLAADVPTRDAPATAENVEADRTELDEQNTRSSDIVEQKSNVIGQIEQNQSRELSTSGEAFLQTDQIDISLPPEVETEGNESNRVLQGEAETKEVVSGEEALQSTEISSDGPSDKISALSASVPDNIQEIETPEIVASEDDQTSRTIQKQIQELDDEIGNKVEQEDIAEKVDREFMSNEEKPVRGELVEGTIASNQLTESVKQDTNDRQGGINISEVIKDAYTDVDGVSAADAEEGFVDTTQPTQSTGKLEESIGETSVTVMPDEHDDSKEESIVEQIPHEEAVLAEPEDVEPASIGQSIAEVFPEESTLLHVSEKDAENEDVRSRVTNEAWSDGNEPTLQTDVSQDESEPSVPKFAYEKGDVQATPLELGDRDFTPAVPTKEILTEEDASKIEEVESVDASVAADEVQEATGHVAGKPEDTIEIYENKTSATASVAVSDTTMPHSKEEAAEVGESIENAITEVIPMTSDSSSAVPEKEQVLATEIEPEKENASLEISQRKLTDMADVDVTATAVDIPSTDGQAATSAASDFPQETIEEITAPSVAEERVAKKIDDICNTNEKVNQENTSLALPSEATVADKALSSAVSPEIEHFEDDRAEKYEERRNLEFTSAQAVRETKNEINGGEILSDGYVADKADYGLASDVVEIVEKVDPSFKEKEEKDFDKDHSLQEKGLEYQVEYKDGVVGEYKAPILSDANDQVGGTVDHTPMEEAEGQTIDGVEDMHADRMMETPIPNIQGSREEIFEGDRTRTEDALTAYPDSGLPRDTSLVKELMTESPGSSERGLLPVEAREFRDQSGVNIVSKEFEGEKFSADTTAVPPAGPSQKALPDNLQLPEQSAVVKPEEDKEHEDDDHEHIEHSDAAPLIAESSKDIIDAKAQKKSHHNLLSGMSSKVKSSISKVKKVITGKSSNHNKDHSRNTGSELERQE